MAEFNVELIIFGKITVSKTIAFDAEKQLQPGALFRSKIEIKNHPKGLRISTIVYTADEDRAYKVALLFVGRMLDIMSMRMKIPLSFTSSHMKEEADGPLIRRIAKKEDFIASFNLANRINIEEDKGVFATALNWYRKGLYTQEPYDKFLAFWNAIAISAQHYCPKKNGEKGEIDYIVSCFQQLSDSFQTGHTNCSREWIREHNRLRNRIAHGCLRIDSENIDSVVTKLDFLQEVAYCFLLGWGIEKLSISLTD